MTVRIAALLFIGLGGFLGVFMWLVWMLATNKSETTTATISAWIQLVSLGFAFVTIVVALVGAYNTFFKPFSPEITVGPYTWRLRAANSPSLQIDVAMWLSLHNSGAIPGQISDLIVVILSQKVTGFLHRCFS